MDVQKLEGEVRRSFQLVGIRSIRQLRTTDAECLFVGVAGDAIDLPQAVSIQINERNTGVTTVRIEVENAVPIVTSSFVSTRDALLKAAVQWEARKLGRATMSTTN